MEQLNRVELIGTVGNSNIVNVSDASLCKCQLATAFIYKAKDGSCVIENTWHSLVIYSSDKISVNTLKKITSGTKLHVIGRLRNTRYADAEGKDACVVDVIVKELEIINKAIDYEG